MQQTPASGPPGPADHDVAILGAGIAGSILAAILSRHGVKTVLIDAGTHPRFAVGESTIPYTSVMLRILAARYDVPEIAHLSHFSTMRSKVSSNSGQKRNFGFVYHREDRAQDPREINQFVIPVALSTESHMFRQDVDAYMFNVALRYGTTPASTPGSPTSTSTAPASPSAWRTAPRSAPATWSTRAATTPRWPAPSACATRCRSNARTPAPCSPT